MSDLFLINYKVKGIKTLDQTVSLSFYKKTFTMPINTQEYNIKGIYGMNGSGKSAIITSVDILKNLLIDETYLNNPTVQKNLDAMINKKTNELYIGAEFLVKIVDQVLLYNYEVRLNKNLNGKFVIDTEQLSYKKAHSRKKEFTPLVKVKNGEIVQINADEKDSLKDIFIKKTANLLSTATVSALFVKKIFSSDELKKTNAPFTFSGFAALFLLGYRISVYMEQSDDHIYYFLSNMLAYSETSEHDHPSPISFLKTVLNMERNQFHVFSVDTDYIPKPAYTDYVKTVKKLQDFIQIFKPDLIRIDIDRKENKEVYVCNLNMVYETYSVNSEFESTGIKKLIKLFAFLQEMVQGGIVFIDEFDSNLHDVYLCALLEYLMEYGKGQLCFTTHNVGPMDVLKKHKKSIDFLSIDHKIYPWTTNGNYSPSKLYKNGMIEGSPFNVDSIDFIGVFDNLDEED